MRPETQGLKEILSYDQRLLTVEVTAANFASC